MSISILPAAIVALLGVVAVAVLYDGAALPRQTRLVLTVAAVAAAAVLVAAAWGADAATRRVDRQRARCVVRDQENLSRRLGELGFLIGRGRREMAELAGRLAAGEAVAPWTEDGPAADPGDPVARLVRDLRRAQSEAWNAVVDAARRGSQSRDERVGVFVSLARRMQSLSHRAILGLDELEAQVEDPDLLKGLFKVDHLATRTRRQAESLAVIGGAPSRRQWTRPVNVYEVLRSAIAEVEHYKRVKVVPPVDGGVHGSAVADVIHLLAELIENATKYSPPQTQVLVRVESVAAGLAIEVEDRGLGIPREDRLRLNDLLADHERARAGELLSEGRIGLLVVSALAGRHKVRVQLQSNVYGGTQAVVVVPAELTGGQEEAGTPRPAQAGQVPSSQAPTPQVPGPPPGPPPGPRQVADDPLDMARVDDDRSPPAAFQEPYAVGPARRPAAPTWETGPLPAVPAQGGRPAVPPPAGDRPQLPRRRAQTHLTPELASAPVRQEADDEAEHNPGLMAAFQRGMRSALENDAADGLDNGK
ncbi:ATP-binding protein [Actinomadura napierensis]|uniref:histidine kinase n=1 Tax=Actinomadura napierensis TaxID=267854 RepID=A0ABP5JRE1_9ACTN